MKYGDITKCEKCGSDNVKVVKYIISNGKEQYRHQCFNCGFVDASSIKFDSIPKDVDIPLLDDDLRKWYNSRSAMASREDFFSILKDYYLSPEWQIRRKHRLAFNQKFFNGKCERCGINDAQVVHHRSYRLLDGKEHAFDLECLCKECHALIHPHLREGELE